MEVKFYLKDSNKERTTIRLQAKFDGKMLRYPTGIGLAPKQWSKVKQKIHSGVSNSEGMNLLIENYKETLKDEYLKIVSRKETPTIENLKKFLDDKFKKGKIEPKYVLDFLQQCIDTNKSNRVKEITINGYKSLKEHLVDFEKFIGQPLTFELLNKKLYNKLCDYFAYEKKIVNRTAKERYIKNFNSFLEWCVEEEYIERSPFEGFKYPFKVNRAFKIALAEEELKKIYELDLSNNKRLDRVRDILCFECYSGLRYKDLGNITPEKFKDITLDAIISKTDDKLSIPLRPEAIALIRKYFDKNLPFPTISNQKSNVYFKELGELAELNETIHYFKLIGINKIEVSKPKYKMMENHTGRRTFVTLSVQKGLNPLDIMAITGHKDYKSFMTYYQIDKIKVHENFHNAWSEIKSKYETSQVIKNLLMHKVDIGVIALSFGIEINEIKKLME